ncbi:MAG: DMT family transporter [Bacteroidales bacterium]|jgi:drug/metabolite transporter (DMT)-like permease
MIWEKRRFQFFIVMLLALVWGSSFILMKIGLRSFSHNQAAAVRILLASLVLLPLSIRNLKYLKKKDVVSLMVAGFMGSFIPAFLFTLAQTRIDSSVAGILNSLTPVFALIAGMLFFKTKTGWVQVLGLLLGLAGAVWLISLGEGVSFKNINPYALFIVLATLLYGTNVNVIKSRLTHLTGVQITSLSFMFLWPPALLYLVFTDFTPVFQNPGWHMHLLALATLGIVGTALAMMLMNSLIRYTSAVFATSVTYIIPIFAMGWGFLDGEHITLLHTACMVIILLGVYLTNRKAPIRVE